MLSPRAAALALVVTGAVLAGGNAYETFRRSTIPLAIDGRVTSLEVRQEKHPGVDDVHLLHVDGRELHVDTSVGRAVDEGAELRKRAWESSLRIGQVTHRLSLSRDAKGMFVAMPVLLLALGVLLTTRGKPRGTVRTEGPPPS